MGQRLDEGLLHRIQGIRFIAQQAKRHAIRHQAIAPKQFIECILTPTCRVGQQLFVAVEQKTSSYSHVQRVSKVSDDEAGLLILPQALKEMQTLSRHLAWHEFWPVGR